MNRDGTDMTELIKSMMNTEQTSYDNNIKKFGYCVLIIQTVLVFFHKTLKRSSPF